tara:strand:+ start:2192 stop:3199 length:1008 start_codon:yes stop_codon:yes gene_type:complete
MACNIVNNSGSDISGFEDMIQSLVSFSQSRFGFEKPPTLFLNSDSGNASNPLGKTAYYDPERKEIHIYTTDRHPKDIMRSISHELVHHNQNYQGHFEGDHYSGQGYAQKDPHMRKMEQEAYLQGNMCFRDWEDGYKQKQQVYNEWRINTMSLKEWKNKELFGLLSEKWGFGKNTITEEKDHDPNRPIDSIKRYLKSRGVSDEEIAKMSKKDMDKKAAMLRLHGGEDDVGLSENEELEEAAKPDFPDVDGDGDTKEPISKASKEKKEKEGDDKEKKDKDLSKVPPQLRKHVAKKRLDEEEIELQVGAPGGEDNATMSDISETALQEVKKRFSKLIK